MKKIVFPLSLLAALLSCSLAAGEGVKSLRKSEIAGPEDPSVHGEWKPTGGAVAPTFVHQPPLIPHDIAGHSITTAKNDCLSCHGMEGSGAPKPFKTHYMDREGKVTENIAARWWFCTQCHVGQSDAKPLVESTFSAEKEKK